jgi:hypothetical protein
MVKFSYRLWIKVSKKQDIEQKITLGKHIIMK